MPLSRRFLPTAALALAAAAVLGACNDLPTPAGPELRPEGPARLYLADCAVRDSDFRRGYSAGRDVNLDLNDYGRILYDADSPLYPECVDLASAALEVKLDSVLNGDPGYFTRFLHGALVALIFASADQIHAKGGMTPGLDYQLSRVEARFAHTHVGDDCGLQSTDNCMDGAAVSASAYGMIAAYRHARGADPTAARTSTRNLIAETFAEACIHAGWNQPTLCKTPATAVTAGDSTLSLNLGHRYPAYGFGLLTSIAAAVWGYDASGDDYAFLPHEKLIATALFAEMQKTVTNGVFRTDCPVVRRVPTPGDSVWADVGDANCAGSANYRPSDYALYQFFSAKQIPVPSNGYMSTAFDWNGFIRDNFFNFGRYMTYGELAHGWWIQARPHTPRVDNHLPQGGVDGIDANRVITGWACDNDQPGGSVRVTVSAAGKAPITRRAALGSEQWINNACGGGSAHRFSIQLPQDWAGYGVSVSVMDFFGTRSRTLSCASCVVPQPLNPQVTVVWVQPSSASWGPPNTLTAAGHAWDGAGGVRLEWRDVTFGSWAGWNIVGWEPAPDVYSQWSNTIPSDNYCRTYEARAVYYGAVSNVYTFHGPSAGYCRVRIIWVQPASSAGFGPPGSLVVAGEAVGGGAGTPVALWYRDVTANGPWERKNYDAPVGSDGIWYNDIPNADPNHQYHVWADYDVISGDCQYGGGNGITWC